MKKATRSRSVRKPSSIDELLTFAVGEVAAAGEECTFERLVYECYTLFPDAFALNRYPDWPDSARVNKAWLRCRTDRGWITGSVQAGFRLTERGTEIASDVARRIGKSVPLSRPNESARMRERHEAMMKNIRRHPAFSSYQSNPEGFALTGPELRVLLNATLETPRRVLRQSIRAYQNAAEAYGDVEVGAFLAECDKLLTERASVRG